MIIPLSTILEGPLLVNHVIPNLCVLFLLSFSKDPRNTNQSCNYLPFSWRFALPSLSTWWLVCTILFQLSHLYNPPKVLQIYWGIISTTIPSQFFSTAAADHIYTMSYHSWPEKEKAIAQLAIFSLLPCIGPLHISLNGQETLFDEFRDLFELIYTKLFPKSKLAKIPKPWHISLLLKVACGGWLYIRESVKEKFIACKDIK